MMEVLATSEFRRVFALPKKIPKQTPWWMHKWGSIELRLYQSTCLLQYSINHGLLAGLGTGDGKTLVGCLCMWLHSLSDPHTILMVVPASLLKKTQREVAEYFRELEEECPNYNIISYEKLSRANQSEYLSELKPTLIVFDEAHKLKNKKSSVTRRVHRYFKEQPDTHCVAMSATFTQKSIRDFAHISEWCLGDKTPMPRSYFELETWANCLDVNVPDEIRTSPGAFEYQYTQGEEQISEIDKYQAARQCFYRNMSACEGVVFSDKIYDEVPFRFNFKTYSSYNNELMRLYKGVEDKWEHPNGEPIYLAAQRWMVLRQLALGFYYKWEVSPSNKFMDARREWHQFVAHVLKHNRKLDSEHQVALACVNGRYDDTKYLRWKEVRDEEPNRVPVWVDTDFILNLCGHTNKTLYWCSYTCVGDLLSKHLDIPYYKDTKSDASKLESPEALCLSIASNCQGKNLQMWNHNIIVDPPTNATTWEQLMGRTHRAGQKEEVVFDVWINSPEQIQGIYKSIEEAKYIYQTTGQEQKITRIEQQLDAYLNN